jgi:L,D-transpeptidase ErfK/SrfK
MHLRSLLFILLSGLATLQPVHATVIQFNEGFGGLVRMVIIKHDDSLIELARTYDVGYNEITAANPGVDPFIPDEGTWVTIPTAWLLPDIPERKGIVINIAEKRLYYFAAPNRNRVESFPIGIGDEGWDTPTGTYRIIEKIKNPSWHVPVSIRRQKPDLPKVVAPGPDNPLGTHALRLSIGTVLIHGTDRPFGIGRRVSHGCIHLYPEDISRLYRQVKRGTSVTIVRQQVKATLADGKVLVEVHLYGNGNAEKEALDLLGKKGLIAIVDRVKLAAAVRNASGIPTDVTRE